MIGGMESWGSSPADGEREMTDTTTTATTLTTDMEWDAIDWPVTLDEQVTAAMMLMVDDLELGNRDNLARVTELNAVIWEQVKPGPGEAPVEYWLMSVEYLGY